MKVAKHCLCDATQAIERGEGDSDDWHASKESLIQARSDEKTIQEVLGKIYAKQQVSSYAVRIYTLQSCCVTIAMFPALSHVHGAGICTCADPCHIHRALMSLS